MSNAPPQGSHKPGGLGFDQPMSKSEKDFQQQLFRAILGAGLGIAISLAIVWVADISKDIAWLFVVWCGILGGLSVAIASAFEKRTGPAVYTGIRHLLDLSIRVLFLAWLISWAYNSHLTRVEVEKAKKALKTEQKNLPLDNFKDAPVRPW